MKSGMVVGIVVVIIAVVGIGGVILLKSGAGPSENQPAGGGAAMGIPVYPGATQSSIPSDVISGLGIPTGATCQGYTTSAGAGDVVNWYKNQMSGWTLQRENSSSPPGHPEVTVYVQFYRKSENGAFIFAQSNFMGGGTLLGIVTGPWSSIQGCGPSGPSGGGVSMENFYVDVYDPAKAYNGTTIFADLHDSENTRIVEVDMQGRIVWQYLLPESLRQYTDPGFDVEVLSDNHVLFVLPLNGVYEIDRSGTIVWSYLDSKVSHDADRLANGNTLVVWGGGDLKNDAQVKEVNPSGQVVWSWYAKDNFNRPPYDNIWNEGWTHTNAAIRLANGNTLVNMRNFNLTVEVNPQGAVVWSFDWGVFGNDTDPHEPEIHSDNHILIALQNDSPYQAVEIDRKTGENVWTFSHPNLVITRDADRLPNGNTLLVTVYTAVPGGESRIIEVTPSGEIVWQLRVTNAPVAGSPGWIYNADRIA